MCCGETIMTEIWHIADDIGARHWPQRDRTVLDWLVGESGETQGCRYFLKKDNVCGKVVSMRIGMGYDVHRLVEGRPLILGGVTIPYERGLLGHSDADVLAHAVMDALLGAAALGDIGGMFPDSDERWRDADSLHLLEQVAARLAETGWEIGNVDATVLAQAPKLAPYIPEMRRRMANAMGIDAAQVSVKATTEEHLGFTGAGEGMACHAVALLGKM